MEHDRSLNESKAALSRDVLAQKAALRGEFPGWSIIRTTDTGRWWATRVTLVSEDLSRVEGSTFDADTADGLRLKLREAARAEEAGQ
ncbi:hypothetical protein AGRA3207_004916 [Actinomadura graeca]|uniref:Uncharacterized protein n=1 Tax=Actinomadura graeca TaxID=2750812 RepID=A0ABX8R177_9ACTN|nr:hypothetical protein [Actinomadura graeca]QXJ23722.1 hypothetical protein AGRA3207_004916 [Actinomadura graeca]